MLAASCLQPAARAALRACAAARRCRHPAAAPASRRRAAPAALCSPNGRVQAQTVSLVYRHRGSDFLLNLIDTPGHVDFSYEVRLISIVCVRVVDGNFITQIGGL